jgi:hypothetical protein
MFFILVFAGTALAMDKASTSPAVHSIRLPEVKVDLKPGPGRDKTETYCAVCHSLDYITTQPAFSRDKWGETVNKMVKVFGAPIPGDVSREITAYLGTAYGK